MLFFVDNFRLLQAGMPSGAIELWNLKHAAPQRNWNWNPGPNLTAAEPSPLKAFDTKIAIVCDAKVAEVLKMSDGSTLAQFSPKPYTRKPFIALHPTHPYFVIHSCFEPGVELRNWETGETIIRYQLESDEKARFTGATWSKDGRRLALITEDESALIWFRFDPDSKELTLERKQSPAPVQGGRGPQIRFNKHGDRLLFFGWSRGLGLVDANLGLPLFGSHSFYETVAGMPKDDPQETLGGIFNMPDASTKYGMMSIAYGRERTLLQSEKEQGGTLVASDPTGRILAFGLADKLSIIDVATKKLVLTKRWPCIDIYALFFDDLYFYINSKEICCRFPYNFSVDQPSTLSLGVPERVHIPSSFSNVAASHDGKTVASVCPENYGLSHYASCWAKLESEPAAMRIVDGSSGISSVVSKDGNMIGFSTTTTTAIYPQNNGKLEQVRSLPPAGKQVFSADGKWILNSNTILSTDTLQPTNLIFEGSLFDLPPDGQQVASYALNTTVLTNARSGKVFARFEGYHPLFLPDGSKVVTRVEDGRHALHDMKLIRKGVLDLGIPWSGPDYANCVEPAPIELAEFADAMAHVQTGADLLRVMDQRCDEQSNS
jgi:hypothetical protein